MLDATPFLRFHMRRRLARLKAQDPVAVQERQLLDLVARAGATRFGRDHHFSDIRSVADFQAAVPVRDYEAFWADYWEPRFPRLVDVTWPGTIPYFAESSGTTTGRTKFIPVSREMARSNTRAGVDLLVHHLANRPHSRVLGGKSFMLAGSIDLKELADGVMTGDLSGIARHELPYWGRFYVFPGKELARESDWEKKIESQGMASLSEDIRTLAGTPSWVLLFLDRLAALSGRPPRLGEFYPNLEMVVHGGVNFRPYRHLYEAWLEGSRAELREVYPASEGFVALADGGPNDGLRMLLDIGLFYEFVPIEDFGAPEPRRHWLGNVELGRDYAILVSTCAGLWAYALGDTVRFVSLDPPRILVSGRTSYYLSAFGEHLSGEEIERAVIEAAEAMGAEVSEYSIGALYPDSADARGRHRFVVELRDPTPVRDRIAAFAEDIDKRLCAFNFDYERHRAEGFGMVAPQVLLVAPGTFADWMRSRGRLGGQNKVPRVIHDPALLDSLHDFARRQIVAATDD